MWDFIGKKKLAQGNDFFSSLKKNQYQERLKREWRKS